MDSVEQRSDEWRQQRCGLITASCFGDAIDFTKVGKPTAARMKLMRELAHERLSGRPKHVIDGQALRYGTEIEPFAQEAFEVQRGLILTKAEFTVHPRYPFLGASPDARVSDGGGFEGKAPHDEAVHLQTWLEGMPEEHLPQVQGGMACTGAPHWWFVSYDPRAAEKARLYVQKIPRDDAYIAKLIAGLLQFEAELKAMIERLNQRFLEAA